MYPAAPVYRSNAVSQGDKFTASVVYNGGTSYTLTISDTTKGWTQHVNKSLSADNATAEAVVESPTDSYPTFSKLSFTGITVNGSPFADYAPDALTSGGYGPGPLSGGSFSMTPGFAAIHGAAQHNTARSGAIRY